MDIVGKNIQRIRESRGLLQKELAYRADMNPSNLSKLERGEYTWTKDNLGKIASALEISISALFADNPKVPLLGYVRSASKDAPALSENWRLLHAIDEKLDQILVAVGGGNDEGILLPRKVPPERVIHRNSPKKPAHRKPSAPEWE